ncbi:sensor histidine kinase [Actinotalea fermentans]|uniref:histidine kinase n=1 Tax=Actinotalea fermentans TaxID=43671 RepID=A0A511YWU3_9CELL|nr:histidine kinase [Actinotalea fermentans]KGM16599.1 hypothetical protein N867_18220 [Actinotalea fermentans ATCC 43279 = JCM 9966 = DSM 3133]GEN79677.1 two-component sensor histidine kinase [Actinotalea fermentans]
MSARSTRGRAAADATVGPAVAQAGPPPAAPAAPTTAPEAAPFTELSARRLGPVRRYFVRHPVAMDVLVMAVFVAPALLGAVADAQPANDSFVTSYLALTVAATALLFWRRRRPLLVAAGETFLFCASVFLTGGATTTEMAVAFTIYAVAAARPLWVAWCTLAATLAATAGAIYLVPTFDGTMAGRTSAFAESDRVASVVALAITFLVALAIGISVRNRRLHVADLVERANALARDRDQQAQLARAAERSRIAREMHDVVAHSLSVMIALADGAGVALERSPDRARAALDELSGTGRAALADMRRVLGVLDTDPDADAADAAPLVPQPGSDLDELVERFRTAGLPVRAVLDARLPEDANLRLAVYRIVQEALTNTLRHAPGTQAVEVGVHRHPAAVEVTVLDHGATLAVPPSPGTGRGLIGMRERAALYGGTVEAGPAAGGWRVHASIPWPQEAS